jgi:Beta-propeller repeat
MKSICVFIAALAAVAGTFVTILGGEPAMAKGTFITAATEVWVARYNSSGSNTDKARAIAIDDSGNSYVTGETFRSGIGPDYDSVAYDIDGNERCRAFYDSTANNEDYVMDIVADNFDNFIVTGHSWRGYGTSADYMTIKYNVGNEANGVCVEQWRADYTTTNTDHATAIALDDFGNVYVTGQSRGPGNDWDYMTIKYNSGGVWQCEHRYDGVGQNDDKAIDIVVDDLGFIYVTGSSYISSNSYDFATVKYDSDCIKQWDVTYNGASSSSDNAKAMTVDDLGNVYVVGESSISGIGPDYATVKYDASGNEVCWVGYDSVANNKDYIEDIVVDNFGNIYVTGSSWQGYGTSFNYLTIKYDGNCDEQWQKVYDGPPSDNDIATAIGLDAAGNVYVTGESYGSGTERDYVTIKYTDAGLEEWVARYDEANSCNIANAMVVDGSSNVYVTGETERSGTGYDYATVRYCGGCWVGGQCYPDGAINPYNACEICISSYTSSDWSDNNGAVCDDGLHCNGDDTCAGGQCIDHAGDPCSDDGLFCNGTEYCDETSDSCESTGAPCSDDGLWCNGVESCNETADQCEQNNVPNCPDDGFWCNGIEFCEEANDQCGHKNAPNCSDDSVWCNGAEFCDEANDQCASSGDPCPDDGTWCNGTEICIEAGDQCGHSGDPCSDDGLFCNGAESCNETDNVCDHNGDPCDAQCESCNEGADTCDELPGPCDDGLYCNGADTCLAGSCAAHSGSPCDAQCQYCLEDGNTCLNVQNPCDDGLYCNGGDYCWLGSCDGHSGDPCMSYETCDEPGDTCDPIQVCMSISALCDQFTLTFDASLGYWSGMSNGCAFGNTPYPVLLSSRTGGWLLFLDLIGQGWPPSCPPGQYGIVIGSGVLGDLYFVEKKKCKVDGPFSVSVSISGCKGRSKEMPAGFPF